MAITSATGIGSGIDINTIVSQLIQVEGQPAFSAIDRQKSDVNTRLSGLGTLKSALSTFQATVRKLKDPGLFKTHLAASSNESVLKVASSLGAVAGNYSIKVDTLAKAQKSITSAEFSSSAEKVGGGTLTFSVGGGESTFDVDIASNSSLQAIRDSINSADGNDYVTASIINVDSATSGGGTIAKLVLTARNSGEAGGFTLAVTEGVGNDPDATGLSKLLSGPKGLDNQTPPENAKIEIDGEIATRSSNKITDVIPGLTLDLQPGSESANVNVDVKLDNESIAKTVGEFVSGYNKLRGVLKDLGKFGGIEEGATNGALIGDSVLRSVTSQIRQDAANPVSSLKGGFDSLAMIGITIDRDGVMALNSSTLNNTLTKNLQSVSEVFTANDGVAVRLDSKLFQFIQSGGPLDTQQTSLQKQLKGLNDRRSAVQLRLDNMQQVLQKQFIAMDIAVGKFQSTGSYLTGALSKL